MKTNAGGLDLCAHASPSLTRLEVHALGRYEAMEGLLLPTPGRGPRFGQAPAKSANGVAGGDGKEHKRSGRHGVESWRIVRVCVNPPCPIRFD